MSVPTASLPLSVARALSVHQALDIVLASAALIGTERVPIDAAVGRTLAEDLAALRTQPPFTTTAMDGYAVKRSDVAHHPATLDVIGESAAGHPFNQALGGGQAVRIFTGAPLPEGADGIVIQENTSVDGARVTINGGLPDPEHVRLKGGDFKTGTKLLTAGQMLTPRTVALAAAMGYATLPLARQPRVAILATGDELVLPGQPAAPGQIVCSNHLAISALLAAAGATPRFIGIARDERTALDPLLAKGFDADVLVTIGGASVGDHDLIAPALLAQGVDLGFWKIAMRPGKPLMFGQRPRGGHVTRVLGLPGNPVSAYICALLFGVPLIRRLLGQSHVLTAPTLVPVAVDLPANGVRAHYMRAQRLPGGDGRTMVKPMPDQDSSLLSVLAMADALIVRDINAPAASAGTLVPVLPIDLTT